MSENTMSGLEAVECQGIRLQLPPDLCRDLQLLAEVISPNTWNNELTDDNREELMNLLPTFPENDLEEKTRTLEMFFMDVNFCYGTPLRQFHRQLSDGHFNPSIARHRRNREAVQRKIRRYQYRDYLHHTLENTIIRRQQYLELANSLPPDTIPPPLAHLNISLSLHGPSSSSLRSSSLLHHGSSSLTLPGSSLLSHGPSSSLLPYGPSSSLLPQGSSSLSHNIPQHSSSSRVLSPLGTEVSRGVPRVCHPWRATVEHRTKRRYLRELMVIKAEAGITAAELSEEEDEEYTGCGPPLSKKQRKQLCSAEASLPPSLLPIRHTHSTGGLAKDLELLLTLQYNPLDLTDDNLRHLLHTHSTSKRTTRKLGEMSLSQDTGGIKLSDVIRRASENNKRPLPLLAPPQPSAAAAVTATRTPDNRPPQHRHRPKKDRNNTNAGVEHHQHVVKVEEQEEDVETDRVEQESGELASLARYVTLASGVVVKSEVISEGQELEDSRPEKRPARTPLQSTAKRRLLSHSSKLSKGEGTDISVNSRPSAAVNGPVLIKQEVKEEPMDEQDSNDAVTDTPAVLGVKDATLVNSTGAVSVMSVGVLQQPHSCFFCLLRDIICQPREQRLSRSQLECSVRAWQQTTAAAQVNRWHGDLQAGTWLQALPSAVNFLAGFTGDSQTFDLVPYLEYKTALQAYQWIGAGRDSDTKLQQLYNYWIVNRSSMSNCWMVSWSGSVNGSSGGVTVATSGGADAAGVGGTGGFTNNYTTATATTIIAGVGSEELLPDCDEDGVLEESIPAPRCPTAWTVQPATAQEKTLYRHQEKLRYEKPHKAFTYRVHGYESVVGPVKGIYSQNSGPNKARGHSLLTPNRPAYVTILALVRDAVARLPNGEGTRAEICELLRESQYLAPLHNATAESALNSVVSGALDRLHYEQDPCVKYLANRKMWVYLHRNRDEQEFERMHHLNGPGSNKNKKATTRRHNRPNKLSSKESSKAPPNVAIDPLNTSVKVEGGQMKMRPEDVLVKHDDSKTVFSNSTLNDKSNSAAASHNVLPGLLPVVASPSSSSSPSLTGGHLVSAVPTAGGGVSAAAAHNVNVLTASVEGLPSVSPGVGILSPASGGAGMAADAAGTALLKTSIVTTAAATQLAANRTLTAVKVPSSSVRSLMGSSLQTIQVSTATGIQTIKVALPSSSAAAAAAAAQHFAKGTLVGRIAGAASSANVVALSNRGSKKQQQPIGQIIQTSNGAQFIATGISGGGGSVGQVVTGRRVATQQQQQQLRLQQQQQRPQQPIVLNTSTVAALTAPGYTVSAVTSGADAVRPLVVQSSYTSSPAATGQGTGQAGAAKQQQVLVNSISSKVATVVPSRSINSSSSGTVSYSVNRTSTNNLIVCGGATVSYSSGGRSSNSNNNTNVVVCSAGGSTPILSSVVVSRSSSSPSLPSSGTSTLLSPSSGTRVQGISAQQLAGLKLLHTPISAHQLHQSLGGSVVGQKFVVSGNKLMMQQGGKVIPAGVQQLVALQQQKSMAAAGAGVGGGNSAGLQRLTLVTSQGSTLTGVTTATTATAAGPQRVLIGTHTTTASTATAQATSSSSGGNLISVGGKQVLLTPKPGGTTGTPQTVQGQVLLSGDKLGQVMIGGDKLSGQMVASIGGQQLVLSTQAGGAGQQLVLPASALQGGHLTLKGLQAFHTLKVIPSGGGLLSPANKSKPVMARMVQQQARMRGPATMVVSAAAQRPVLPPTTHNNTPNIINNNNTSDGMRLNNINKNNTL